MNKLMSIYWQPLGESKPGKAFQIDGHKRALTSSLLFNSMFYSHKGFEISSTRSYATQPRTDKSWVGGNGKGAVVYGRTLAEVKTQIDAYSVGPSL